MSSGTAQSLRASDITPEPVGRLLFNATRLDTSDIDIDCRKSVSRDTFRLIRKALISCDNSLDRGSRSSSFAVRTIYRRVRKGYVGTLSRDRVSFRTSADEQINRAPEKFYASDT